MAGCSDNVVGIKRRGDLCHYRLKNCLLDVVADSHKGEIANSAFFDESAFGGAVGDFDGGRSVYAMLVSH